MLTVAERPLPVALAGEVPFLDPASAFLWMSATCPVPCQAPDCLVEFLKDDLADHVTKVVTPPSKNRVECANHFRLVSVLSLVEYSFRFVPHVIDAGARWFDQEFSVVLAEVEPKKIEPVVDMNDLGFFL